MAAIKLELEGLVSQDVFRIVKKYDPSTRANLLRGRIIRCAKILSTPSEGFNLRLVVQGHCDVEICLLIDEGATLRQASIGLLLLLPGV